eukprot:Phypoly_transcript_15870.p2 GENE.Phypoly_transcript_15870~~Phypoly_transcript_15870.p2  ORF type:complete len:115 (+),score=9.91 Phypoly_transcript_15870:501-845(+)
MPSFPQSYIGQQNIQKQHYPPNSHSQVCHPNLHELPSQQKYIFLQKCHSCCQGCWQDICSHHSLKSEQLNTLKHSRSPQFYELSTDETANSIAATTKISGVSTAALLQTHNWIF